MICLRFYCSNKFVYCFLNLLHWHNVKLRTWLNSLSFQSVFRISHFHKIGWSVSQIKPKTPWLGRSELVASCHTVLVRGLKYCISIFIQFYCFSFCFTSPCKSRLGISGGVWLAIFEDFLNKPTSFPLGRGRMFVCTWNINAKAVWIWTGSSVPIIDRN